MTTVGLAPITLRNATLTISTDEDPNDYTAAVNEVTFAPDIQWGWLEQDLGRMQQEPCITAVRWLAVVGYAQDFTTPDALAIWLVEHAAQVHTVTFTPAAGGRSISAEVLIVPGRLGGPSGGMLTATTVLPLFGEPVISEVP